ncbi:MAG: hypothetical protein F4187_02890 [Gemmatimonadetes bacterium]|nr:hypothetical protein [Gemmatimonadota bacterium]
MHPTTPSDVIPMLAAAPRLPSCSPLELAAALRRLHRAGVRRGYMLLAPTRSGREPVRWWARLCNVIQEETGLGVVLVEASHRGVDPVRVLAETGLATGIAVLHDLTRGERSALLEISRGVCTGDLGLLAEARARGAANYEPGEAEAAIRDGRSSEVPGLSSGGLAATA